MVPKDRTCGKDPSAAILRDLAQKVAQLPEDVRDRILPDIERLHNCIDRTEQALAESERLRLESDERFRVLADNCPLLIWMSDSQGGSLYINQTYREFIGITLEELHNFDWHAIFHPDDAPEYLAAFQRAVRERKEFHGDARVRGLDGAWLWITSSAVPRFSSDGMYLGHIGNSMDIDRLKRSEQALRESEQNYRNLFNTMLQGVFYQDADGTVIWMNPAAEHILGKTKTEFLGHTSASVENDTLREDGSPFPGLEHPSMIALRTGQTVRDMPMQVYNPRKQSYRWIMISAVPVFRDGDQAPHQVLTVFDDITERKQAEEEVLLSKAKMDAALASTPDAVFVSDADGHFVEFNDAFATFHRFGNKDECSKTFTDYPEILEVFDTDGTPAPLEMWAVPRALRGETARNAEYRLQRKDTGERWIGSYSFSPIRDAHGTIVGSIVAARDITERKQAEEELRQSRERERARAAELEALMDAVPALIWISRDPECREITGNRYGHEFFRMGPGGNVSKTNSPEDLPAHKAMKDGQPIPPSELPMQVAARTGKPARDYTVDFVFEDGEAYHLLGNVNPILDVDGKPSGAIGAFLDITRLRQLELEEQEQANQMEIQRRLLDYREQERQVLARDLHDGPVQNMSSLLFNIQILKETVSDPASLAELDQIAQGLKSSIQTLRSLISELRPPSILRFGLAKALKFQLDDFRESHPEIDLDMSQIADESGLSEQARLALYRITKEAVTNIAKHAGATKIVVRLACTDRQVLLDIRDNGKGFALPNDLVDYSTQGHYGLIGMIERAEGIGGTFRIATRPDCGTTITVTAPVRKSDSP